MIGGYACGSTSLGGEVNQEFTVTQLEGVGMTDSIATATRFFVLEILEQAGVVDAITTYWHKTRAAIKRTINVYEKARDTLRNSLNTTI
jgi:hypothetical protein